MRKHIIAALAATALLATALPSDGAARPQLTDPKGDSLVTGADLMSATFESTFKKIRKGKKKVKKVPTGFNLTLRLADSVADNVWYEVQAVGPGCAEFNFHFATSKIDDGPVGAGCADGDISTKYKKGVRVSASGNVVRWRVPVSAVSAGSKFSSISAVAYNLTTAPLGVVSLGYPAWDTAEAPSGRTFVVGK